MSLQQIQLGDFPRTVDTGVRLLGWKTGRQYVRFGPRGESWQLAVILKT